MAAKKRQCINCWYFRDAEMAGNGWCTHPDRQQDSSVRLMVRTRELACRNSWGTDLFVSKDSGDPQREAPDPAPSSRDEQSHTGPIDDTVTSVVTPRLPHSPNRTDQESSDEDRVVSDRPSPRHDNSREGEGDDEDDGQNDAARLDQDERARVIARGSGDAIASARARLIDRRRQRHSREDSEEAEPDEPALGAPAGQFGQSTNRHRVVTQQERLAHRFTRQSASADPPEHRHTPVPRAEVDEHQGHHAGTRDRYDTVPAIDPNFDLPGWRRGQDQVAASHDEHESKGPVDTGDDQRKTADEVVETTGDHAVETAQDEMQASASVRTYEHVLNRARRIRESKRHARPHPHPALTSPPSLERPNVPSAVQIRHDEREPQLVASAQVLPPLRDEQIDQPGEDSDNAPDILASQADVPHAASTLDARRQSWLARFGIDRNTDNGDKHQQRHSDAVEAESEQILGSSLDDVEQFQMDDLGGASSAGTDHPGDWYPDARGDTAEPIHAQEGAAAGFHSRSEHFETDAFRYTRQPDDRHAYAGSISTRTELPDIEALFTEPYTSSAARMTDDRPYAPDNPIQQDQVATLTEPEAPASARRWIDDPSPSPRDSFFRARRFQDWNERRTEPQPVEYDDEAGEYTLNDDEPPAFELPDLDTESFDLRDVIERGGEALDMRIDIAPDVPRACRTCRSFRAADGGARGWCTNEWAFTHRRMVNEDDLACETTIGSWWLPDDRYWLPENTGAWADATPRMDALIARGATSPNRRISGE